MSFAAPLNYASLTLYMPNYGMRSGQSVRRKANDGETAVVGGDDRLAEGIFCLPELSCECLGDDCDGVRARASLDRRS